MGRYLLFSAGGSRLAVPLERVRQLVDAAQADVRKEDGSSEGLPGTVTIDGAEIPLGNLAPVGLQVDRQAETLAVLEEKGLTAGLFIDRITGIRDEKTVQRRDVPAWLARFCPGFQGLLEADDGLYLLLDVAYALNPEPELPRM